MKTIAGVLIAAALAFGSGCAPSDWIERTLVTVDVTGVWAGSWTVGPPGSGDIELTLQQSGPKVTGQLRMTGSQVGQPDGPIEGTVSGDMFSFRQTHGRLIGDLQVKGDEMTGSGTGATLMKINLRRRQ